jgi:hypothetical protein
MTYENRNQIDYGPLRLRAVKGSAKDLDGVSIPKVCVGVFTETEHKLVATAETDEEGLFEIRNLPAGNYRIVAKYSGFCPANARLQIQPKSRSRKSLKLRMRAAGIDTCSYFELK